MALTLIFLLMAWSVHNLVTAHAYIQHVAVNDRIYAGFRPDEPFYVPSEPVVSWNFNAPDRGFVNDYEHPDIICHRSAIPSSSYVEVVSGENIRLLWSHWPAHQGPVITYLAACNGPCQHSNKSALNFFKIDELGLLNDEDPRGTGYWALDSLIANNNSWSITIPPSLSPGAYVLRHEVINLDDAFGKAQHYPQCINLEVTSNSTQRIPEGVLGTELYKANDPGITFDIYHIDGRSFDIPGPPLVYEIGEQIKRSVEYLKRRSWSDFWKQFGDYASRLNSTSSMVNSSIKRIE